MDRAHLDSLLCQQEETTGVSMGDYDKKCQLDINNYSTFKRKLHIFDTALAVFDRVCAFQVEAASFLRRQQQVFVGACCRQEAYLDWS